MNFTVLTLLASIAIASTTGTVLRCSEESFDALGGALPSSSSSSKYLICSEGVVLEMVCPRGHFFDASSQVCIMARDSELGSSVTVANQFEELCTDPNEVNFLPNPTNCTRYILCFGMVPIELSCSSGLFFNPRVGACDEPSNVVCGYSCPTVDDPGNPVWLPDARLEDCARHYMCFQGNQMPFTCPNNLYFDVVSRTCTDPQYASCRVPGVYCTQPNGTANVENPRSCGSYYTCLDGFPHFRTCAEGEYFYPVVGRCVTGFCEATTTTTTTTTTATELPSTSTTESPAAETTPAAPATIDPTEFCADIESEVVPYPGNCFQYILCMNGIGAVSECSENEIFIPVEHRCAAGDRETCILS